MKISPKEEGNETIPLLKEKKNSQREFLTQSDFAQASVPAQKHFGTLLWAEEHLSLVCTVKSQTLKRLRQEERI